MTEIAAAKSTAPRHRTGMVFGLVVGLTLYFLLWRFGIFKDGPPNDGSNAGERIISKYLGRPLHRGSAGPDEIRHPPPQVLAALDLTEEQCRAEFPGLTKAVDDAVALGPFTLKLGGESGLLQARIKDGQLSILHAKRHLSSELLDSRTAALHQIHRALLTSPSSSPLPDTVFALNVEDQPFGTAWTYALPAYAAPTAGGPPIGRAFLMPHFAFWAWRPRYIGSLARAAAAVDALEAALPFVDKDPRVVWRGTLQFTNVHRPSLRQDLLAATAGRGWADVQALDWRASTSPGPGPNNLDPEAPSERRRGGEERKGVDNATNAMMIEDFCRYRYVAYTEGITYSGRLPFLQLCRCVLLAPPLAWLQHTTHLVRPLFSSDLSLIDDDHERDGGGGYNGSWTPSVDESAAWPRHFAPGEANMVFVAPDWSDLGATVRWLEAHPDVAEGIAARQREMFAGGGYFSPAAEACYWRALIRGWASVARVEGDDDGLGEGIPWETFVLDAGR